MPTKCDLEREHVSLENRKLRPNDSFLRLHPFVFLFNFAFVDYDYKFTV